MYLHTPFPQVGNGPHRFTYDHVFGGDFGGDPELLYDTTVSPLVEGLFKGYNATVFAYGQTGSGKTYTMGSSFGGSGAESRGVIPRAMQALFTKIASDTDAEYTVRVGFCEIHKEDIRDLLAPEGNRTAQVSIRELPSGGIVLAGATEREVKTQSQMVAALEAGTERRATAETGMNKRSSRSHAIFTITVEQRKLAPPKTDRSGWTTSRTMNGDESGEDEEYYDEDESMDDFLTAKLALVDLAGSERLKRTRAEGQRLKEGININKGLLALGNVINALSEGKVHVPYRDSKLTRMLQDSLGGNSRTVMIACVSPADVNLDESLNTLRYASRARAIKNRPVVNRDPVMAQIAALRAQLVAAKAENEMLKRKLSALQGGCEPVHDEEGAISEYKSKAMSLEKECQKLRGEATAAKAEAEQANTRMVLAQSQRDKLASAFKQVDPESAETAVLAANALAEGTLEEGEVLVGETERVAHLEHQIAQLKQLTRASTAYGVHARRSSIAALAAGQNDGSNPRTPGALSPMSNSPLHASSAVADPDDSGDISVFELDLADEEAAAAEQAHAIQMAKVASEMERLQTQLAAKEKAVAEMANHAALQNSYDKQLKKLQAEKESLSKERVALQAKIEQLQEAADGERLKLASHYRTKIKDLDAKVKTVKAKERKVIELEKMKQRADDACSRLHGDIHIIKQQRVALMRQAEKAQKEHLEWRKGKEREMMALRKQGRADAAKLKKLETLHSRQQQVLRRKVEEAEAARRRLKELEDRAGSKHLGTAGRAVGSPNRPNSARNNSVPPRAISSPELPVECRPNPTAPRLKSVEDVKRWVDSELDVCCTSYDLQKVIEGEKAARTEAARLLREVERRIAANNNPDWWPTGSFCASIHGLSREELYEKKMTLLKQIDSNSNQIQELQLKLVKARSEEEEQGKGAADLSRWNTLRSVSEAQLLLQAVFTSASQQRASVQEVQLAATELGEEVELLRLKLEISEQEKIESAKALAEARAAAATAAAIVVAESAQDDSNTLRQLDEVDEAAASIIRKLQSLSVDPLHTIQEEGVEGGQRLSAVVETEVSAEEQEDQESAHEESSTSENEEGEEWDPSKATPPRGGRKNLIPIRTGSCSLEEEAPVLLAINEERRAQGKDPVRRLTKELLKHHLKDKSIYSQEWKAGCKLKEEMVADYRAYLGLLPSPSTARSGSMTPSQWVSAAKMIEEKLSESPGSAKSKGWKFSGMFSPKSKQLDSFPSADLSRQWSGISADASKSVHNIAILADASISTTPTSEDDGGNEFSVPMSTTMLSGRDNGLASAAGSSARSDSGSPTRGSGQGSGQSKELNHGANNKKTWIPY